MSNPTDISKLSFDLNDLIQRVVTNGPVNSDAITQCKTDVKREPLEIAIGINIITILDILYQLIDTSSRLQVNEWEVGLNSLPVERRRGSLPSSLY